MVKLIADSTCDLSQALLEQYSIDTAPLSVMMDGETFRDRVDISPDTFYERLPHLKSFPTTAMPSPQAFCELMEDAVSAGYDEILCICMSSGTSGSYQAAVIGRALFVEGRPDMAERVYVLDSRGMSHGSGYLLIKSARLLAQGMTFRELIEFNETWKLHIKHYLSVDDLDNLIRSGRLTNVSAVIGKLLNLKPIMSMRNGKGAIVAKERGRKMVLNHYLREFGSRVDPELTDFIIIGYTTDKAYAEVLRQRLTEEAGFTGEILILQMGVAVGVHVGHGGLSLFFIEKDRCHDGLLVNEIKHLAERRDAMLSRLRSLRD